MRLGYLGDVIKIDNKDLHSDKQLTQSGIELIGGDETSASEVLNLTLASLGGVKIDGLIVEFCLPRFLDLLLSELKTQDKAALKAAIIQRNISKIHELAGENTQILTNLVLEIDDQEKIKANLAKLPVSAKLRAKIDNLLKIIDEAAKKYPQASILIGIFSDKEFLYHEEVGFTIFTKKSFYPVARGGKYQINDGLGAVGSTIYVDQIRKLLLNS
jgi:ATP phosphoribosyltransferase regulatory subunit